MMFQQPIPPQFYVLLVASSTQEIHHKKSNGTRRTRCGLMSTTEVDRQWPVPLSGMILVQFVNENDRILLNPSISSSLTFLILKNLSEPTKILVHEIGDCHDGIVI